MEANNRLIKVLKALLKWRNTMVPLTMKIKASLTGQIKATIIMICQSRLKSWWDYVSVVCCFYCCLLFIVVIVHCLLLFLLFLVIIGCLLFIVIGCLLFIIYCLLCLLVVVCCLLCYFCWLLLVYSHRFVFFHHPPFCTAQHDELADWMDLPFDKLGATAVFSGHQHVYERIMRNNMPYIVNGLGSSCLSVHVWCVLFVYCLCIVCVLFVYCLYIVCIVSIVCIVCVLCVLYVLCVLFVYCVCCMYCEYCEYCVLCDCLCIVCIVCMWCSVLNIAPCIYNTIIVDRRTSLAVWNPWLHSIWRQHIQVFICLPKRKNESTILTLALGQI